MMIIALTSALAQASTMPGTVMGGVTTTARSGVSGSSFRFLYAFFPHMRSAFGFMGYTSPRNVAVKFSAITWPSFFLPSASRVSVAPKTATERPSRNAFMFAKALVSLVWASIGASLPGLNDASRSVGRGFSSSGAISRSFAAYKNPLKTNKK